jgi:hypothetical protein
MVIINCQLSSYPDIAEILMLALSTNHTIKSSYTNVLYCFFFTIYLIWCIFYGRNTIEITCNIDCQKYFTNEGCELAIDYILASQCWKHVICEIFIVLLHGINNESYFRIETISKTSKILSTNYNEFVDFVCAHYLEFIFSLKNVIRLQLKYKPTKSLKIPKGQSESVYQRTTDNTMAKRKRTKGQTTILQNIYIRLTFNTHKAQNCLGEIFLFSCYYRRDAIIGSDLFLP